MAANTGNVADLTLRTVPVPTPKAGEVRVKMHAVTTNPVDFKRVHLPAVFPGTFGVDGAGVVDALGEGVTTLAIGDRVHFFNNVMAEHGTFAPFSIVRAAAAAVVPKEMSMEVAAVIPCAGWTAYEALICRLKVAEGMTVIVNGAAGGVGHLAVQIAVNVGAKVIAVCSGDEWCGIMKALGCSLVVDYRKQDIVQEVMSFTKNVGADCALDTVDLETATTIIKALRFGGSICHIATSITTPDLLFTKAITTHHVFIPGHFFYGGDAQLQAFVKIGEQFNTLVVQGKVTPRITAKLQFSETKAQLLAQQTGRFKGKALITI